MVNFFKSFSDPGLIFFPPYLAAALVISVFWLWAVHKLSPAESLRFIFSKKVWVSRSTGIDIVFCIIYLFFLRTIVEAAENSIFLRSLGISGQALIWVKGTRWTFHYPALVEGILATLATMLSIDLATYVTHRFMHRINPLWAIHSVHHSATQLTPLTTYRQHPFEPIILNVARGLFAGIGLAVFQSFFSAKTPVITFSGLGAGFFLYMFTANLQHSNVPVRYPKWLGFLLLSPHLHHIHHSHEPRHQLSNFGVVFSFWDRLFRTYRDEKVGLTDLRFGLAGREE